ncbi:Uncharacterised protein [Mycobacterium tuberculosis]|uniref:Uncharacterized protein n=1 Tax=Mycobacterium tuberculosis TaxID=1773 RepID=A0A0T9CBF4_MYCTX|nr:Uncharacterised protein [Mycobacterium tuberculosis]CKR54308.1 Uncharacterised protein [Mycobacterium tuberculosis]COW04991.1 Uncharacterised protein [Mycobacterium tuberculosis]
MTNGFTGGFIALFLCNGGGNSLAAGSTTASG